MKLSRLFLIAAIFVCVVAPIAAQPQTFQTLVNLNGNDGAYPDYSALIQSSDGNLYGTTSAGGANNSGTVFSLSTAGTLTTIYSFCARPNCADGAFPVSGLALGKDGNLYGTTYRGGLYGQKQGGDGTVFRITSGGKLVTLHSFKLTDGANPTGTLVEGRDGNFYGTTCGGGAKGHGTIFKLAPSGTLTMIYSFVDFDGVNPTAGLIQATDGDFYGTTVYGGATGYGTAFKITVTGKLTTLYSFCLQGFPCPDGSNPRTALVEASDGTFYGTTPGGGANGVGIVFQITPAGNSKLLHSFTYSEDGAAPYSPLVQATDGNLYGTTSAGGANTFGTVFMIDAGAETVTVLHTFNFADGSNPVAGLVQASNGILYGSTELGGTYTCSYGCGTMFSLSVGLGQFIETVPSFGKVGVAVNILGTSLTGATGVTFNGSPATFTVVSPTLITTTVPTGATVGTVQVMTPGGLLTSNTVFRVR